MSTKHSIRCARPSDLIYLSAIEREAAAQFQATTYPAMANADLASAHLDLDHDYVWVLADEKDHPIGFAIAHVLDESVHLHELDVHPHYARQGLGRRLIEAIADWARTRGATALTLSGLSVGRRPLSSWPTESSQPPALASVQRRSLGSQ